MVIFPLTKLLVLDGESSREDKIQTIGLAMLFLYGFLYICKKFWHSINSHEQYTKSTVVQDTKEKLFSYIQKKVKGNKRTVIYAGKELIPELTEQFGEYAEIRLEDPDIKENFIDHEDFDNVILYPSDNLRFFYFILATDSINIINSKKTSLLKEGEKYKKGFEYYMESLVCLSKDAGIVLKDIIYI